MILRGSSDIVGLLETIEESGFLGELIQKAFDEWASETEMTNFAINTREMEAPLDSGFLMVYKRPTGMNLQPDIALLSTDLTALKPLSSPIFKCQTRTYGSSLSRYPQRLPGHRFSGSWTPPSSSSSASPAYLTPSDTAYSSPPLDRKE